MNRFINEIRSQKHLCYCIGVLLALLLLMVASRIVDTIALHYQTEKQAIPIVRTIKPTAAPIHETLVLPGTIKPWHGAPIYARVNGYLKQWLVDIGDQVNEGDLLAVIEAPELDAQLRQAEADLKVAMANNQLAQVTAKRWVNLLKTDSVSKQETDEKIDAARALEATVLSSRANLERLRDLVRFERITAPFTGTISDRTTDIGALITAGSETSDRPLFRMVQRDPLRLYVKIPETDSSRMKPNLNVTLRLSEYPGMVFEASLLQTAHAIDPKTRTLLAQFLVKNKNGQLLPGSYTDVTLEMPPPLHAIYLPVNALLFRAPGLQVATVTPSQRVKLKSITISRDFGSQVEIDSGITQNEDIIINPIDSIYDGQPVQLATASLANKKKIP